MDERTGTVQTHTQIRQVKYVQISGQPQRFRVRYVMVFDIHLCSVKFSILKNMIMFVHISHDYNIKPKTVCMSAV